MIREALQNVEPRLLSATLGACSALLLVAMALYGIKPEVIEFNSHRGALEMLQTRMEDPQQMQQLINEQRGNIQALQHQLNGESNGLPTSELESYLIGRLQRLAWQSDVQLVGVRPGKARRVIEFDEISFEVTVAGEYQDLFRWLNSLGDSLGFVMVTRYNISPMHSKGIENTLNMDTTLVFYRVAT